MGKKPRSNTKKSKTKTKTSNTKTKATKPKAAKSSKKAARRRKDFSDHDKSLKVGDLVTSGAAAGYFRISRILKRFYASDTAHLMKAENEKDGKNRQLGDEYNPLFYVKRLLNSKLKKSLGSDEYDASWSKKLSGRELKRVERALEDYPGIEETKPKLEKRRVAMLWNMSLALNTKKDIQEVLDFLPALKKGLTFAQIKKLMATKKLSRFQTTIEPTHTLQLVCFHQTGAENIYEEGRLF